MLANYVRTLDHNT